MISELEVKTERLQQMLEAEKLGGVLLNAQQNFAWLTGGRSNGIDLSRDNGAANILVRRDGKRYLIANIIELERTLTEEISAQDFEPVSLRWQDEKASADAVVRVAEKLLPPGAPLATDLPIVSRLRTIEPFIARCRYQLTDGEIDRIRLLGRDVGQSIGRLVRRVTLGMTEMDVARAVRSELALDGIFPVVVLVGADERIKLYRHPVPSGKAWEKSLLIAVCARRQGLIVSLTRIVCAGEVPSELSERTEAAAAVNAALYSATVPGTTGADLYRIAAAAYDAQGFAGEIDKHHQGGACGYRTRDWVAYPVSTEIVNPGQAFAWNPSITGTKTEETGVVTETGFEVVTATDGFPEIVTSIGGREYSSPGILSLSKGASA